MVCTVSTLIRFEGVFVSLMDGGGDDGGSTEPLLLIEGCFKTSLLFEGVQSHCVSTHTLAFSSYRVLKFARAEGLQIICQM